MTKTVSIYSSSVGQKIVSAVTGLFLCAFLVVHVSGNLLLFKNDGGRAFDAYAAANASSLLIRTIEIVLFAGIAIHIYWGIRIWLYNRRARPRGYALSRPSENSALFSRTMIVTGLLILAFLGIHLWRFWVPVRFQSGHEIYQIVATAFQNPLYSLFYIISLAILAYHLRQGFQSAFQTFGVRPFWRGLIEKVGILFWLVIPLGFASMPIYFFFKGVR